MQDEYIIEMEWRCACGAVNEGLTLECERCGRPKTKGVVDEMPADTSEQAAITDPVKLARAESGPAWPCPYCEQAAPAGAPCPRCGAPEPGSGFTVGGRPATWPRWSAPRDHAEDRPAELPAPPSPRARVRIPMPAKSAPRATPSDTWTRRALRLLPVFVGVLLLLGVVGVLIRACQTREISGTVTSIAWTNTVLVDRWEATPGEGWEAPFGAERVHVIDPHRPHGTHPVFDHDEWVDDPHAPTDCGQTCTPGKPAAPATPSPPMPGAKGKPVCVPLGNGTARCKAPATSSPVVLTSPPTPSVCVPKPCPPPAKVKVTITRDEPTYDAWLGWETWDWTLNVRRSFEEGAALPTRWPDPLPVALGPGERERSRREGTYRVTVAAEGRTYTVRPRDEDHLLRFPVGSTIAVRVNGFGSLVGSTPEP